MDSIILVVVGLLSVIGGFLWWYWLEKQNQRIEEERERLDREEIQKAREEESEEDNKYAGKKYRMGADRGHPSGSRTCAGYVQRQSRSTDDDDFDFVTPLIIADLLTTPAAEPTQPEFVMPEPAESKSESPWTHVEYNTESSNQTSGVESSSSSDYSSNDSND